MGKTALYARISRDASGQAVGVERQIEDGLELCERKGWPLPAEEDRYIDNDVSASRFGDPNPVKRSAYRALLAAIEGGEYDRIVMAVEDRTHRQVLELAEFINLCRNRNVRPATVGTEYDLADPDQLTMWFIKVRFAEAEVEKTSRRVRRARIKEAEKGKPHAGGSREFGTVGRRQVRDPETGTVTTVPIVSEVQAARERELIQEAATRILAGDSLRGIRLDWMRRGVRTVTGKEFQNQTLRKLLLSPRLVGYRIHLGRLYPGTWPAILDLPTWEAVGAVLRDPARTTKRGGVARHLLSGFLFGGRGCGHRLNSQPRNGRLLYRCTAPGCGHITRLAAPIEELITEALFTAVESPTWDKQAAERPADDPTRELHEQLARDQGLLDRLEDKVLEELVKPETAKRKRAEIERRMDIARDRLARLGDTRVAAHVPRNLRSVWPNLSLDRRRAILMAVLRLPPVGRGIVVHPQGSNRGPGGFDPDSIDPDWQV
jgi:site-specific DNA recombinase